MVVLKIVGGLVFLLGLLIVIGFPWLGGTKGSWQPPERGWAGVIFGIILMAIGILLTQI